MPTTSVGMAPSYEDFDSHESLTMLKGLLKVIDAEAMDRLHEGVLNVLEKTGLQIQGRFLLEALAEAGCRVDFDASRAWFKPELVERQIAEQRGRYREVRSSLWYPFCSEMPADDIAAPDEFAIDFGHATPWLLDYADRRCRKPTSADQVEMIKLGDALDCVKAVNAPLIASDFDPRIETIESARLLLTHTTKPGWVGTSSGAEVKYLAELAALVVGSDRDLLRTRPPVFVSAYCTTSPLKLDNRACDVLQEALKYKFPVNFAPMPILGATTPITPAGSVVVAAAEILGCITATSLIDPEVFYYSTSISGEMDMRSTQVCYCTPAAILTDAALHQLFRYRYGMVHNVDPSYLEASVPGSQAAFMKIYRQMALGATSALSLPIGLLDNGSVFSPAQAMIDLEMNEAVYKLAQGMEVDDETLCLDLINELDFCRRKTYLETEHTLKHFRQVGWNPKLFDRSYHDHSRTVEFGDRDLLERADRTWRDLLAAHEPAQVDPKMATEVDRIVEAAKLELLA